MLYGRASIAGAFAAVALSFGSSGAALADGATCGPNGELCSFQVQVNGQAVGTGTYDIDPVTGDISLPGPVRFTSTEPGAWQFSIDSLTGNADPVLIFATSAITGANGAAFSVAFNLPINLDGPQIATSQIGYSLTAGTPEGARIQPLEDFVLNGFDLDTSVNGQPRLDKEVGAGDEFQFTGVGTQQSQTYFGGPTLLQLNPGYDTMSAVVSFGLSPNSAVGISGLVSQVPEPSTYALLFAGLAFVAFVARRRMQ